MLHSILPRRYADFFDEQIDKAAAGRIADLLGDFTDRLLRADQKDFRALNARVDDVIRRRKSGAALEDMCEI